MRQLQVGRHATDIQTAPPVASQTGNQNQAAEQGISQVCPTGRKVISTLGRVSRGRKAIRVRCGDGTKIIQGMDVN